MTFSLLGRCPRTGELGMVVSSSSPAVAARCAYVRAGVGVAATQNVTDPRLGPALLDALGDGATPDAAVRAVAATAAHAQHRQLAVLDAGGRGAALSGAATLGTHGERIGRDCVAAGNLLATRDVLDALVAAFTAEADRALGDRLLDALAAGLQAGGEVGPVRSAGLLMAGDVAWPIADLRVDWGDDPVGELRELWAVYRPQLRDYVTRALDPGSAPGYGVPGEDGAGDHVDHEPTRRTA